jgi:hypothetical protein
MGDIGEINISEIQLGKFAACPLVNRRRNNGNYLGK